MRLPWRWRRFLVIAAFAASVVLTFLVYGPLQKEVMEFPDLPLSQGDLFPFDKVRTVDVEGKQLDFGGAWRLLVYSDRSNEDGIRRMRYSDVLSKTYFPKEQFSAISVIEGISYDVKRFAQEASISHRVIADDGTWRRVLGIGHRPYAMLLVDPSGKIVFFSTTATLENLRQLVEKHLTGKITYGIHATGARILLGAALPEITISNVVTGRESRLPSLAPGTLIFFSPGCADCSLPFYMSSYSAIRKSISAGTRPPELIFSAKFTPEELRKSAELYDLQSQMFISTVAIPGIEDRAYRSAVDEEVLVTTVNPFGQITDTRTWKEFVRDIQQAH